ncbi:MAG TPA: hypothetical protein DER28_00665 [Bifidobacterium sp.]|nr:hypothetical protein [Bifidobacterium sp.]HCF97181.1 hypothetical protein [Bifidobacterium sp.]
MSRKKIVPNYAISLDIGNASVGWAAFTPDYRLMRAKGRELIGVRLFEPAQTAEARRMARTTRRRYSRRRWRLHMLDAILMLPWQRWIRHSLRGGSTPGFILLMRTMRIIGMAVSYSIRRIRINVSINNIRQFIICAKL